MSRPSTLYYDGYDPNWIIGTGKQPPPPPPAAVHHLGPARPGTNRPVGGVAPFASVPANIPLGHHKQPGSGPAPAGKHLPPADFHGPPAAAHAHAHGQQIGKSNLGPLSNFRGNEGKLKSAPGAVGINPNPYLHPSAAPLVHAPLPAVHATHDQGPVRVVRGPVPAAVIPPVRVPVVQAPVPLRAKVPGAAQVAIATPGGLREGLVNPLVKVIMWVPLHCDGCEKKWKKKLTDLPGFQGYDVERKIGRVTVFGHVAPSSVLTTIQETEPRTQMWRH